VSHPPSPPDPPQVSGELPVGRVAGVYGVRGWIRVESWTEPRTNLLDYDPWLLSGRDGAREWRLLDGRAHGRGLVAKLAGVDDPEAAHRLLGSEIRVRREALPDAGEGTWYWADLVGLQVRNLAGEDLGRVTEMLDTGANDVMVLAAERRRLVPFLPGRVVKSVDLAGGIIRVDWDATF